MPRNSAFQSHWHEPLRADKSLELQHDRITGAFSFLNPTRAAFKHLPYENKILAYTKHATQNKTDDEDISEERSAKRDDEQLASNIEFNWRSRDNRKGRHALIVDPSIDLAAEYLVPLETS